MIDPVTFQLNRDDGPIYGPIYNNYGPIYSYDDPINGGPFIYNNSIINDNIVDTNFTISCRSTFGNGDLKLSSDNEILDGYFSADNFDEPLYFLGIDTIVAVDRLTEYDLSLSIVSYDCAVDGNITCYSQASGESTTVLLTCGE